jgi:hypothetical protein
MRLSLPAYDWRNQALARDLLTHHLIGQSRPAIGAISPVGPALQEPSPTSIHSLTTFIGWVGERQLATTLTAAMLTGSPPKQR